VLLTSEDFAKDAPKAKLAISAVSNGSMDGIDVLDFLLHSRIPTLGATDFNAYEVIMSLVVENGMLLINFLSKAQDIQAQLTLSAHPQEDNTLFKQFF
jgi:hypothetical protein